MARCDSVSIGSATGAVTERGSFSVRVPRHSASYETLSCGWRLPLFLSPGDDLRISVAASGDVAYEGRGSAPNDYLARTGGLVGRSFIQALFPLRLESYEAFAAAWDSLGSVDAAALESLLVSADIDAPFAAMERARIRAVWAHGHLAYPVLHWRDGDGEAIRPTPGTRAVAEALPLDDSALLKLSEFKAAVLALVHEQARAMLREDSTYQSGDNRWTRAEYDYAVKHISDPSVRDFVIHATLTAHLDQNGSEGLEPLLARFAEDVTDPVLLRDLVVAYADERRYWAGDQAEAYKFVGGTTLEAHFQRPDGTAPDARLPVFVWLHGGSFDTGAWYQCPFVCRRALDEGMAVFRLEQRSSDRFQTTPADQLADVRDALTWIRRHADRLRLDAERVVLGGFSSGATLSIMAAVLNESDAVVDEAVPDAAVGIAACVAPLEGDGWFRKSIARTDDPERFSPIHQVRSGVPPLLLIHGTADEYCEYAPVPPFAADMAAEGNDVEVTTLEEQPHFFLFRSPPSRAQALEAFVDFLRERDLVPVPDKP